MKPRGKVSQKLKQLRFRHIKREMSRLLKQTPANCVNNVLVQARGPEIRVCQLDCTVCDLQVEDRSLTCPKYEARYDKDGIKDSLKEFFQTRTVPEIAVRFPDVAALLWALTEEGGDDPQAGPLIPNGIPTCTLYGIPLWVDTEAELEALQDLAGDYELDRSLVQDLAKVLEVEPKDLLDKFQGVLLEASEAQESARVLLMKIEELEAKAPTPVEGSQAVPLTVTEYRPWWRRWF